MRNENNNDVFSDLIGQEIAINILKSSINKNQISPAYIFCGPEGVGRKKAALKFFEGIINQGSFTNKNRHKINSFNHPDLLLIEATYLYQGNLISKSQAEKENLEIRSSPQIRLEQIKEVKRFIGKKPINANIQMVLIDDLDLINESAANALLKTIEEPSSGTIVLIAERIDRILSTIISRCHIIPFQRLNINSIKLILDQLEIDKKIDISLINEEKELLMLSNGSPGSLIKNIKYWDNIPQDLRPKLKYLPKDCIGILSLAKEISEIFNIEEQLWLINWLQQRIWLNEMNTRSIKRLEKLRFHIISFVQPRLAWEVALLDFLY